MDRTLIQTAVSYIAILLVSISIPTFIFIKWRLPVIAAVLLSLILNVVLVNLYFQVVHPLGLTIHPFFDEAHEVSWLASAIITALTCKIMRGAQSRRKKS